MNEIKRGFYVQIGNVREIVNVLLKKLIWTKKGSLDKKHNRLLIEVLMNVRFLHLDEPMNFLREEKSIDICEQVAEGEWKCLEYSWLKIQGMISFHSIQLIVSFVLSVFRSFYRTSIRAI